MSESIILNIIILLFAVYVIYLCYSHWFKIPRLIGLEKDAEFKTYTIIDSEGNKEYIITSRSLKQLISDLDKLQCEYDYLKCTM